MSSELRRAKERARVALNEAALKTTANLRHFIPEEFGLRVWSRSIEDTFRAQWCSVERHSVCQAWDWGEIARRNNDPKDYVMALMSGERLSALFLVRASAERVKVEYLEGDPRPECPLVGVRVAIALDFAAAYGQRLGCTEIHLHPVNEALEGLYCDGYGFEKVASRKGAQPYLKRNI